MPLDTLVRVPPFAGHPREGLRRVEHRPGRHINPGIGGVSHGYAFTDPATGQLVRVSGEVIITLVRAATPGVGLRGIRWRSLRHSRRRRAG